MSDTSIPALATQGEIQLSANAPGKAVKTVRVHRSLLPPQEKQTGVAAPGFSLAQPLGIVAMWVVNQWMEDLFDSPPISVLQTNQS